MEQPRPKVKYVVQLLNKDKSTDLVIQEFFSLLRLSGYKEAEVPPYNFLKPSSQSKATACIKLEDLQAFPFIVVEVEEEMVDFLGEYLSRGIGVGRFGELLALGDSKSELEDSVNQNREKIQKEERSLETFAFVVLNCGKTQPKSEQEKKIEELRILKFEGKCQLRSPERVFVYAEFYNGDILEKIFIWRNHKPEVKRKSYVQKYLLSDRYFLGPTTLDTELSFIMVNQAMIKTNSLVLDPFVGTAGILLAASHFGALCFGLEIDIRVIQGYKVGRVNSNSSFKFEAPIGKCPNVFTNFNQYNFSLPEIIRCDSAIFKLKTQSLFDAVICDPPYGRRASARESRRILDPVVINKNGTNERIIPTDITNNQNLTQKLFELSLRYLKKGGRLVFLYPGERNQDLFESMSKTEGFKLISISENLISGHFSRYLITLEKQ